MDYGKEVDGLKENLNWFKPETGQYTIKILSEPKEFEWKNKEGKTEQAVKIEIETKGNKLAWSFSRGETYASLFGQIMLIGRSKGKLMGQVITLLVKGDGKKNSYTIMEALPLIQAYQTPKEQEVR